MTALIFSMAWSKEANHQKHDTYTSIQAEGLIKMSTYVRVRVEIRKFDEGRAMDGNKSYYLSEFGLI